MLIFNIDQQQCFLFFQHIAPHEGTVHEMIGFGDFLLHLGHFTLLAHHHQPGLIHVRFEFGDGLFLMVYEFLFLLGLGVDVTDFHGEVVVDYL